MALDRLYQFHKAQKFQQFLAPLFREGTQSPSILVYAQNRNAQFLTARPESLR
jgi:hypothetical protein